MLEAHFDSFARRPQLPIASPLTFELSTAGSFVAMLDLGWAAVWRTKKVASLNISDDFWLATHTSALIRWHLEWLCICVYMYHSTHLRSPLVSRLIVCNST